MRAYALGSMRTVLDRVTRCGGGCGSILSPMPAVKPLQEREVLATSSDSHLGSDNSSGTRESEPQREGKYSESAIGNCSGYSCMQI